ncbi:MAG: amino acid-binding protein [Anaerolineae bacterium]|nr:amino acid-binding protein [Anaerolineae bacterium]
MRVKQLSAFLENRPGRLLYLLNILAEAGINLIAHNIVDASDFGIVHLLVDEPEKALQVIRDAGLVCSLTEVLQVAIPDEPGAFVKRVLEPLAKAGVNIEYSYAYSAPSSKEARIVLKVDDLELGERTLQGALGGDAIEG